MTVEPSAEGALFGLQISALNTRCVKFITHDQLDDKSIVHLHFNRVSNCLLPYDG